MEGEEKAIIPTIRGRESIPSSVQFPMLNPTNYTVWALRMKIALRVHKVWDIIEPGGSDPERNDIAMALLFQSIPETLILQLGEQNSAKLVWDAIKTRHMGADRVREARLQTLNTEFDRLMMKDTDTIDSFAGKLSELSSKSAALGEVIEESKLVKKFLKSLPRQKYIHITASLEQVLDLNTTGFEDIVGRLKAYEERIGEEIQAESHERLLFHQTDSYNNHNGFNGGRSRGGRGFGRNRGRGRFNTYNRPSERNHNQSMDQNRSQPKYKKDHSKVK